MRGASIVTASNGVMALATFARSIVFARMLGPENMGIAALAIAVYGLLGLITDIGFEKLLVQSPSGESRTLQGAAHLLAALRGVVCTALVYIVAAPVVSLFGEPEAANALGILAGVFVIRGLAHTDKWRFQRGSRFGPSAAIDVSGVLASLAMAPLLAVWLGDYRAVALALLAQGAAEMIASHVVAERSYRWSRDRESLRELWSFGLPLLMAGVLMFASMQGDRFIVASLFTMEELGVYAVAFGLAQMPVLALGRVTTTLFLPALSAVRDQTQVFRRRLTLCAEIQAVYCIAFCCPVFIAGAEVMTLVFGDEYASGGAALAWLALGFCIRLMRSVPALAAIAFGDTKNSLLSSAVRAGGVVVVLAFAMVDTSLVAVSLGIVVAESMALAASSVRLRKRQAIGLLTTLRPMLVVGVVLVAVAVPVRALVVATESGVIVAVGLAAVAGGLASVFVFLASPVVRHEVFSMLSDRTKGIRRKKQRRLVED